jgi:hypothetical protein
MQLAQKQRRTNQQDNTTAVRPWGEVERVALRTIGQLRTNSGDEIVEVIR